MKNFYFTFGMNHETKHGVSLGNHYVIIQDDQRWEARAAMNAARGDKWAFCYDEEEFAGQVEQYGLKSISLDEVRIQ